MTCLSALTCPSIRVAAAAALAAFVSASAGLAATITVTGTDASTSADPVTGGAPLVDGGFDPSGGTVSASSGNDDGTDDTRAVAIQHPDGYSQVFASGNAESSQGSRLLQVAGTAINYTYLNTNLFFSDSPTFDFRVGGISAQIDIFGADTFGPGSPFGESERTPGFQMDYKVIVNGATVFEAGFEAYGYNEPDGQGATTELMLKVVEQLNLQPLVTVLTYPDGFTYGYAFAFDEIVGSVALGTLAPGESLDLRVIMGVRVAVPRNGTHVVANMGDPNAFRAAFASSIAPAVVPLPATAWLLLAGLGVMGALRARRRRHHPA